MDAKELQDKISKLDDWIRINKAEAVHQFSKFAGPTSEHVFHAHIGRNNNTFVDSIRTQFQGPEDFIAQWVQGLHRILDEYRATGRKGYQGRVLSEVLVLRCVEDEFLRAYTFRFLERNFYRNYKERIRAKPNDELWSIWFGSGNLTWGLMIAPSLRGEEWTNDKSQMRREGYEYWTLGHVMETGLLDPNSPMPIRFPKKADFVAFYRSVLKRVSNSLYEQGICDRYLDYLLNSPQPEDEPLLIPEFRYAGKDKEHRFRLDFAVLNGHSFNFTGFELSPASTHIRIEGIKSKTQLAMNAELANAWEHEMDKRNAYFEKYGISVLTFADAQLKDLDMCFEHMRERLQERRSNRISLGAAVRALTDSHGVRKSNIKI
jgi:hypothetical protein